MMGNSEQRSSAGAPVLRQDFQRIYLVDLRCLACGRDVGLVQSRSWPCGGAVLLRPGGQQTLICVARWWSLRCAECNGNVYADEVRTARLYPSLSRDELDTPRRGRPPNWLVALRRASLEDQDE